MSIETPTGRYLGSFLPGSEAWHEARKHGVGGSEVAPILGLSPFESRFSLYHRKVGTIPPLDLIGELEWGHRVEPMVAQKYADEHPEYRVVACGTYCHETRPYQVANPDRLLLAGVSGCAVKPLEIKYSLYGDGWGDPGTEQIPAYYRTQALHYMDTLGFSDIDVAVFIGGAAEYREYTIRANAEEAAANLEAVKDFLDDIDTGTLPNLDGHTATYQAVKELHPEINGEFVNIPDPIARGYLAALVGKKDAEEVARLAASQLAMFMGEAKDALWNGTRIASRRARGDGTPYLQAERNIHRLTEGLAA